MKKDKKGWGEAVEDLFKDLPTAPKIVEIDGEYLTFEDGTKIKIFDGRIDTGSEVDISGGTYGLPTGASAWREDDASSSGGSCIDSRITGRWGVTSDKSGAADITLGDVYVPSGGSYTIRDTGIRTGMSVKGGDFYVDDKSVEEIMDDYDKRIKVHDEVLADLAGQVKELWERQESERSTAVEACVRAEVVGGLLRAMDAINDASPAEYEMDEKEEAKLTTLAPGALGRTAVVRGAQMGAAWVIERIREIAKGDKLIESILKDCEGAWAIEGKFEKKSADEKATPWKKYS